MSNTAAIPSPPAERVSRDSINRINFLTGSSVRDLRDVTVVLALKGKHYKVHFDSRGQVRVRSVK